MACEDTDMDACRWDLRCIEEVVVDRLFEGKTQLTKALQPLLEAAEQTLALDERSRLIAGAARSRSHCH